MLILNNIWLVLIAYLTGCKSTITPSWNIPNTGKFFYAQMQVGNIGPLDFSAYQSMDVLVSNGTWHNPSAQVFPSFKLALNLQVGEIQIQSKTCPASQCTATNRYDQSTSNTYKQGTITDTEFMGPLTEVQSDGMTLVNSTESVTFGQEQFKIQAGSKSRETNLTDFEFVEIVGATNLITPYDGFIGLLPYQGSASKGDNTPKEANFMYQLQQSGKITNQVIMIDIVADEDALGKNKTVIKFGGYDDSAFSQSPFFAREFPTVPGTWAIKIPVTQLGGIYWSGQAQSITTQMFPIVERLFQLSPHLPYLYIPMSDLAYMSNVMNMVVPGTRINNNIIGWTNPVRSCEYVKQYNIKNKYSANLSFSNFGGTGNVLTLKGTNLYIEGDRIGQNANACYLGVFSHGNDDNTWFVGAHYMSEYVTILDNSRANLGQFGNQYIGLARKDADTVEKQISSDYYPNGVPTSDYNSKGLANLDSSYIIGAWNWKPPPPPKPQPTPHHDKNETEPVIIPHKQPGPTDAEKEMRWAAIIFIGAMILFTLFYCLCPCKKYTHNKKVPNYKTYVDDEPLQYRLGQPGTKNSIQV